MTPAPDLQVGDVVAESASVNGEGVVREVLWVNGSKRNGGARWRALVAFPDKRPPEGYQVGHMFCHFVDVVKVRRVGSSQGRLF